MRIKKFGQHGGCRHFDFAELQRRATAAHAYLPHSIVLACASLQEGEGRRVAKIGTVFDISAVLGKNDDDILSDAEDMCDRMITADPMRLHQLLLFLHTCAAVALFPTGCAEVVIQ